MGRARFQLQHEGVDAMDTSIEVAESDEPTECELACYQHWQDVVSAPDCDAWCHGTADQWLSACLGESSDR